MNIRVGTPFQRQAGGSFYVRYIQDGKEKWKSLRTKDKHTARRVAQEVEKEINNPSPESLLTPLAGLWRLYERHHKVEVTPSTMTAYRGAWQIFLGKAYCTYLEEVTPLILAEYRTALLEKGLRLSTINRYLIALAIVGTSLKKKGIIKENPFKNPPRFKPKAVKRDSKPAVWLSLIHI